MSLHRTTARGVLLLLLMLGAAGSAWAAPPKSSTVPTLIFPVAGAATYIDDFGQPRAGGAHQGNDMMAAKKTPVVAVEAGKVKFWTTSASAGCMLYLYGASGTTYVYIHLNNDLTMQNDNRGKCVPGVSYATRLEGRREGVGRTDDRLRRRLGRCERDRIAPALRGASRRRRRVSPYPYLQSAQKLLFFAKTGTPFTLALTGTVVSATDTSLTLTLATLQAFPMNLKLKGLTQSSRSPCPRPPSCSRSRRCPRRPPPHRLRGRAGRGVDAARACDDEGDARRRRRLSAALVQLG